MRRVVLVLIGPLPSTGMPSGFTTRPMSASPAGVSMMRPVVRTSSPSLIFWYSPRMIAETVSSSRLNARPNVSRPKSRSSEAMHPARPWMRAMPSPTSTTVPTSTDSAFPSKRWICALMMSVISELFAISLSSRLAARELAGQALELRAQRCVDETVADLHARAADEPRVDRERGLDRLAAGALELSQDVGALALVQFERGGDLRVHDALASIDEIAERARDVGHERDAIALDQDVEDGADRARLVLCGGVDRPATPLERDARVPQRAEHVGTEDGHELVERAAVLRDGPLLGRDVEERFRVAARARSA